MTWGHKHVFAVVIVILLLAGGLRFWQASSFDIYRDEAMNAYRAVGLFDYLGIDLFQTSPVNLYEIVPGWAHLSFHDAPPLVFWIWNFFFSVFGDNTFVLRLPFILAGLAITLLLFLWLRRAKGIEAAIIGSVAFAVSSYAIWTALSANNESLGYLFSTLSIWYFWKFFKNNTGSHFLLGCLMIALSLASKYTTIFLLPAIGLYILIWRRDLLINADFWRKVCIGAGILIIVLSPVIIYNYQTLKTRGHFDAALSSMVGMQPEDFKGISGRAEEFSVDKILNNYSSLVTVLTRNSSLPYTFAFFGAYLYLLYRAFRRQADEFEKIILTTLTSIILMFLFLTPADRYVSIITPFMALAIGIAGYAVSGGISPNHRKVVLPLIVVVLATELVFAINTNVLLKPFGTSPLYYSPVRLTNLGFNELEAYLRSELYPTLPEKHKLVNASDLKIGANDIKGNPIVVFDASINWSAWMWYLFRHESYYRLPIMSTETLANQGRDATKFVQQLEQVSGKGVHYISAVHPSVQDVLRDGRSGRLEYIAVISDQLDQLGVPYTEIPNQEGIVVFRIYHLEHNSTHLKQVRF